jgi:ATP-dependent DNA helicase RecQ
VTVDANSPIVNRQSAIVNLQSSIDDVLHRYWGYSSFRPLQREAIDAVLASRDSLVVLPTGGGKSLCFQLPALLDSAAQGAEPLALVISPLIALMKDQVDGLVAQGVAAACLHSGQTSAERQAALGQVRSGACRLLYVAPERAVGATSDGFAALVGRRELRYVAIDEAHCISQWGHDFRPEYRQLRALRDRFGEIAFHAFTATATPRVRADIVSELALRQPVELVGPFDRPNLVYRVVPRADGRRQIQQVLSRHPNEAGIIYCLSRKEVETMAESLQGEGVRALPYHAGLADQVRHQNQDAFLNEDADVMVATVAFGMGIDRSNVRFVIHAGAPRSLEHYQQEAGRAGRDGLSSECVLISSPADFARWRSLLESTGEWSEPVRLLMRDMERYAAATTCRHRALVEYFGQRLEHVPCGACDWCLGELERVPEPDVLAQKILSAIARTGQRWGVGHVVSVLRGESSDTITSRGHDQLSVFGLLRDVPASALRGYVDQLTQAGFIERTGDQYPTLQITGTGADLLRGRAECVLYRQPHQPAKRRKGRVYRDAGGTVDESLFGRLRQLRLELARARGVPPYVIFHDTTLRELAARRPGTLTELLDIPGIGERKAEVYGAAILALLASA